MGFTHSVSRRRAATQGMTAPRHSGADRVIALAGNPNVGKSTVFNELTGLNQHTGNWPGKTVTSAQGHCKSKERDFLLVDLPGTYSLLAHSAEEEVARDFLCFGGADAAVVVCDATCLERNLNLALQIIEITPKTVLCVNLMDEARKKKISIDLEQLSKELGVAVVGTSARSGNGLGLLLEQIETAADGVPGQTALQIPYPAPIERAIATLLPALDGRLPLSLSPRWIALRLLEGDESLTNSLTRFLGAALTGDEAVAAALRSARAQLLEEGIDLTGLRDRVVRALVLAAEGICLDAVRCDGTSPARDRKIDRLLTSRRTGIPVMLLLLTGVFWLTLTGANLPSALLFSALFRISDLLAGGMSALGTPAWLSDLLINGVYRVLAWVVAVMLPPMAIFFPLFTLLEDVGYLPRVAFNLDHYFQKAHACGKQALTMCMGESRMRIFVRLQTGIQAQPPKIATRRRDQPEWVNLSASFAVIWTDASPCDTAFARPSRSRPSG